MAGTTADLLDRDAALATLDAALAHAAAGHGQVVAVRGPAGIGKTQLIDAFLARHPSGTTSLRGSCDDLITPRPLAPLHDIGRQVGGELGALMRAGASRDEVLHALLDHLARVPPPVVLVLEDLHWADEATLDLALSLSRRIAERPLLMVISLRADELLVDRDVTRVLAAMPAGTVHHLDLPPLSLPAVSRLAAGTGIDPSALHRVTGGNPFYVTEVVASGELQPTPSVAAAVAARVGRLPAATQRLLELVSVVPARVEAPLLDRLEPDWPTVLEPAERLGIVTLVDDAVAFRHELARAAVEQTLSRLAARRLHARVLEVLQSVEVEPSRVVHHADLAGDVDAIVAFAPAAARIARAAESHREAVAHYTRALQHADRFAPDERARLSMDLARSGMAADQPPAALDAAQAGVAAARESGDAALLGEALSRQAWIASWASHVRPAAAAADEAIHVLEPHGPSASLALAYAARCWVALSAWDAAGTRHWAARCDETAAAVGDPARAVHGEVFLRALELSETGDDGPMRDAITRARDLREREITSQGYTVATTALVYRREHARADQWCEESLAHCEEYEYDGWARYFHALRAMIRLDTGEWRAVESEVDAALERHQHAVWATCMATTTRGRLWARTGHEGAREELERGWAMAGELGVPQTRYPAAIGLTELDWLEGTLDGVREELAEVRAEAAALGWAAMVGEIEVWASRSGATDVDPDRLAGPFRLVLQGRHADAARLWERLGCRYEQATCLVLADDPEAVLEGLAILDELGAAPLGRRTRSRLRELGVTAVPRGPREETREHPAGLTARQVEVLVLLGEQLTNQQIADRLVVSKRTVDHHVGAILMKLGASSRQEAVTMARSMGVAPAAPAAPEPA